MNENELRERLASATDAEREFYQESYRFSRFGSLSPLAIFILGGAFAFVCEQAVTQWRYYATIDMNFLVWVILAGSCLGCAIGCYVSLRAEAARWALRLVRVFDRDFLEKRLTLFSRSWMDWS